MRGRNAGNGEARNRGICLPAKRTAKLARSRPQVGRRLPRGAYRADRSRGRIPGSGLGLTVARELVAANGGSVEVESTGPAGTTFRIGLSGG
jgi:signal transduction histidine kinase